MSHRAAKIYSLYAPHASRRALEWTDARHACLASISSWTALQIIQCCVGSRGPYGGGVFISHRRYWRVRSLVRLLCSPRHPAFYNPFHPGVARVYLSRFVVSAVAKGVARDATIMRRLHSACNMCETHLTLERARCFILHLSESRTRWGFFLE